MTMGMRLCVLLSLTALVAASESGSFVWWEAEGPAGGDFPASTWLSAQDERERSILSGGEWLSVHQTDPEVVHRAEYVIEVPADGSWRLWARQFRGDYRWRMDDGEWHSAAEATQAASGVTVKRAGDRYLTVQWHFLALDLELSAGSHRFEIETIPSNETMLAIDAFMLGRDGARPRGALPPGQSYQRAAEGWFAFHPARDVFEASILDLRRLNQEEAGIDGRVRGDGSRLVFERSGEPVRFWGATAGGDLWSLPQDDMDYVVRRLAKMGVNLLRLHVAGYYETEPGPVTAGVHRLVTACKREGIYVGLNWFCTAASHVQGDWHLPGCDHGHNIQNLAYIWSEFREPYLATARTLFGTVNPDTGLSLAQDPAVAFIELMDEDSLLFWTFMPDQLPTGALEELEQSWAQWLIDRYGSLEAAQAAWGEVDPQYLSGTDQPEAGRMALYPAMRLGGAAWQEAQRDHERGSDQLRFLVQAMRDFYRGTADWLDEELGYDGLVVASNWKTVDERVLGPLEMHSYAAVDVTARNTYFSGDFKRKHFHPWSTGDEFRSESLLRHPEAAITSHIQATDLPHFLTEGGYSMPNRFRTEEQLVMASYASLQGMDALMPFILEPDWNLDAKRWPIQTPVTMGQYPAAALIYRQALVQESEPVVEEALALDDLYAFKGASLSGKLGLDEFQSTNVPEGMSGDVPSLPGIDPLSFYVGRVTRSIAEEPGPSRMHGDLSRLIDRERQQVRSVTGELLLDYEAGLLRVDAAQAQGATGFFTDYGPVTTADAQFDIGNEYGAVVLVSLDGQPIASSKSMLLQVMSEEQAYGWATRPVRTTFSENGEEVDAEELVEEGTAPITVRELSGSVSLTRPDAAGLTVVALDHNGYPQQAIGDASHIELQPAVIYYHITAAP